MGRIEVLERCVGIIEETQSGGVVFERQVGGNWFTEPLLWDKKVFGNHDLLSWILFWANAHSLGCYVQLRGF